MDPSIMKLLEDDEDETMHSGADVEAFTAALNRDIEGHTSTSQPSYPENAVLSHGGNPTSSQLVPRWHNSNQEENATSQTHQEERNNMWSQVQHSTETVQIHSGSGAENQQQQIVSSQGHSELPMQRKQSNDDQQQLQVEQNSLQMSQKNGAQISEQSPGHLPEKERLPVADSQNQYPKLQKMNNQLTTAADQASNPVFRGKLPFAMFLPVMEANLDKDRAMQLRTIFAKLRKNEINKEDFVRHMRNIAGDNMVKQAVAKVQMQTGPYQFQLQSQASLQHQNQPPQQQQQQPKMPNVQQFSDPQSFTQLHQKGPPTDRSQIPTSTAQGQNDSNFPTTEKSSQKSRETEHQLDSPGMHLSQSSSASVSMVNQEKGLSPIQIQGINKQQQQLQHLPFPHTSFPMYATMVGNYSPHSCSGPPISGATTSRKSQTQDSQMRQVPLHQGMVSNQLGGATQPMNMMIMPKYEMQNSLTEPKRLQGGTHLASHSTMEQNPAQRQSSVSEEQKGGALSLMVYVKQELLDQTAEQQQMPQLSDSQGSSSLGPVQVDQEETTEKQVARIPFSTSANAAVPTNLASGSVATPMDATLPMRPQIPSAATPVGAGMNMKTPPKRASISQKRPVEAVGTPSPLSSKKQKVTGAFLDQSIEQLNDVTAVSGVNLREEEEQLLSAPKEESRASEATRRVVQEEEERLILQKIPLQKKLAQLMSKSGIKSVSNDVERCLSLCVEERMCSLISNLIRLSKQRVDIERPRHHTIISSDVRHQILMMNRKAKEEWEKKQAEEAEQQRKLNEAGGNIGVDGDKDNDEARTKTLKANKEEDDKMRTTAANFAARAAVGGDDMLSKWQLMAEQARQKREGGADGASIVQTGRELSRKALSTMGQTTTDNQEVENRGLSAAAASGPARKFGRNSVVMPQSKVARTISVKDVIAVLEREPQMSKSTLMYRLYEKICADAAANDRR
ncbi:transcription initiation factor TFIID subunit 4b-like isoform X2 [Macadamia integrifolia]|uniref:transcription initiation factor TFIID subunit 4b-like isoform X2 n=1 Tax=Macadamia integrifolia TaxID=60698 RepID=UPI001C4F3522|nr:transcription initiation factor TFIID subunit 4b-like isoform X2 [Macadamia integrifolia]XP_042510538.1 transcription initiation factor TFIID subunit 4b-like isoform X2 [Macadamia integrifolia]XP_042510539.1 transcription initiation factor TFIID subunit 4b-like isoform X2 [Macadamia integrifolia]XP_042510540.1 transcription initiation factor TFIID subunit 4b-like isoform X2 [Macadamia integrifolia]XP_042510541.1 transcription initiation factor TFIID subunit 4b-like isoform X2 [Macadamia inte